jgi:hypothetical protein
MLSACGTETDGYTSKVAPSSASPTAAPPTPRSEASASRDPVIPGDSAVWWPAKDARLRSSSTAFTVDVSRLGCNSGVTGKVLEPSVDYGASRVVLTFHVQPDSDGGTCPSNERESYDVILTEPLNDRTLVDGQCLRRGEAATTSYCLPDGTRWAP